MPPRKPKAKATPKETSRYRAIASMGEGSTYVKAGEVFTATADDKRVRSGMVVMVPDEAPDEVSAAFERAEQDDE